MCMTLHLPSSPHAEIEEDCGSHYRWGDFVAVLLALMRPWFKGGFYVFLSPCPGVTLRQSLGPECSFPTEPPKASPGPSQRCLLYPQVKWMMYWIVFAFFTTAETLTDIILSW